MGKNRQKIGLFFPDPKNPNNSLSDARIRVEGRLSSLGGRRSLRAHLTGDYWLELLSPPPQNFILTDPPRDCLRAAGLLDNIQDLADPEVIVPVPPEQLYQGFYSQVFVVQKPSGKCCLIINLRKRNKFLRQKSFRMESIYSVRKHLLKDAFMATIYLRDIYPDVLIALEHQSPLRFAILMNQGIQHWQFRAPPPSPFGLAASSRVFTKVLAEAVAYLHLQGISLIPYLDNLLFYRLSLQQVRTDIEKVILIMEPLGWIVNREKSPLEPS